MRQANYLSPTFYSIIRTVNSTLLVNGKSAVDVSKGQIIKSKYDIGRFGNSVIWRITSEMDPSLLEAKDVLTVVRSALDVSFPQYNFRDKTVTIGTYKKENNEHVSIKIMLCNLEDNYITKEELAKMLENDSVSPKLLDIESRMFKRDDDTRDAKTRLEDFADSLVYEPKLIEAELKGISDLKLCHQEEAVTLEPDYNTDFIGEVNGIDCKIEGKSTRSNVTYDKSTFANYIINRIESRSLGSLHGADYCLFVLKASGDVICFNCSDASDNWLAGNISKNEATDN